MRQALSALLSNTTTTTTGSGSGPAPPDDVVFKAGSQPITAEEYEQLLGRAKFCLAPVRSRCWEGRGGAELMLGGEARG